MADTFMSHNTGKVQVAKAALGTLTLAMKIKLITADFTQAAALAFADLTFGAVSGAPDWTPTFGTPAIASGVAVSDGGTHDFICDGGGTPRTVYGAALVDTQTGPVVTLISTVKFNTPAVMSNSGDTLHAAASLRLLTE